MLFNSVEFALFLPVVFVLYWFVVHKYLKAQNLLLLAASYFFYGFWDWRFLILLALLSLINYFVGILIDSGSSNFARRTWLLTGLTINLGVLIIFKYLDFFIDSFVDLVALFGYNLPDATIRIILPLGISFYVFLSMSYIIDIFTKSLTPTKSLVDVLLTLSFFPIILAGPIQRPISLLPQIRAKREFDYNTTVDGLRQILWGLFTKVVIADNLSPFVNIIFSNYNNYSGSTLLVGAGFYMVQIYADFAGYSNIAIGTAKLFGFRLMQNFAFPYFARDIAEFWRKWHISLTTWFRDYIFLPLSFTLAWKIKRDRFWLIKKDLFIYIFASSVTWILTGLWHGSQYTFILWGAIHGLFLIVYRIQIKPEKVLFKILKLSNKNKALVITETAITLCIVLMAWIFFRSESAGQAVEYISRIFSASLFTIPEIKPFMLTILTIVFFTIEGYGKNSDYAFDQLCSRIHLIPRWILYLCLTGLIFYYGNEPQQFIYFQF